MAWIESHQSLATHRKTKKLKRLLKIKTPQAVGHLHLLWWWCLDNAPSGSLKDIDDADLSDAAQWPGDPEKFVAALTDAEFIDREGRELHDWYQYAGKLVDRRKANADRQQAHRNALRNSDVTGTSRVSHIATVPTVPTIPTKVTSTVTVTLPDFIDKDLWNDFLEMRKKLHRSPTDKAIELLIKDLENYKAGGDDPNEVLKRSIKNSWQGLFPLKDGRKDGEIKRNPRALPKHYTRPEDYGK